MKRIYIRYDQAWVVQASLIENYCIWRFDKREEANAAIEHLNGTIPHGRTNPISVKIAEEHGKQKAAYFAGWEAGRQQARR